MGELFFNLFIIQVSYRIIKKIITLFELKIGYEMKNIYVLLIIMTINSIYGQCEEEYSTVGILTDLSEEIYNDDESVNAYSIFSWT